MNDKQREEFYNNNPKYKDMSDEEVAKDIAKIVLMLLLLKIGLMFFLMYGKFIV